MNPIKLYRKAFWSIDGFLSENFGSGGPNHEPRIPLFGLGFVSLALIFISVIFSSIYLALIGLFLLLNIVFPPSKKGLNIWFDCYIDQYPYISHKDIWAYELEDGTIAVIGGYEKGLRFTLDGSIIEGGNYCTFFTAWRSREDERISGKKEIYV